MRSSRSGAKSTRISGNESRVDTNRPCDEVWIPLVVLGQIKAGYQGGTQRHRNESLLRRNLAKSTIVVLPLGRETAEHYARIFVQLKRAGTPVPDNDLWIAALAPEYDLTLITRDRHFDRIPQLPREPA